MATSSSTRQIPLAKLFIGLVIGLLSALLLMFIVLYAVEPSPHGSPNLCTSQACIRVSAALHRNLDWSVSPCHDFYGFACGGFQKSHSFEAETLGSLIKEFSKEQKILSGKLFELMYFDNMSSSVDANLGQIFRSVRQFYATCMSWHDPMRFWPSRSDLLPSGWASVRTGLDLPSLVNPLVRHIDNHTGQLEDFLARLVRSGSSGLLKLSVTIISTEDRWIELDAMEFGLASPNGQNATSMWKEFKEFCQLVGLKLSNTSSFGQMLHTFAEVSVIANTTEVDKFESLSELQQRSDNISSGLFNWADFFRKLRPLNVSSLDAVPIHVKNFGPLIWLLQKLKPEVRNRNGGLYDLLRFDAAMSALKFFPTGRFDLLKSLYLRGKYLIDKDEGGRKLNEYATFCMAMAINAMPQVAVQVFKSAYIDDSFVTVDEAVQNIREAMLHNIDSEDWITPESKLLIREKLTAIESIISDPTVNISEFAEAYSSAAHDIKSSKAFGDVVLAFKKARLGVEFWKLSTKEPGWKASLITDSGLEVNAFYFPPENAIFINLGLLNNQIYNKDYPENLLYGGIGSVIGHEIGHAFDQIHRLRFRVRSIDADTEQKYLSRAKCLVRAYDRQIESDLGDLHAINGTKTLKENFADIVGINAAYRAYKTVMARSGRKPQLVPGDLLSRLTPDQLFFVQSSMMHCGNAEKQTIVRIASSKPHSPLKVRLNAEMMQSKDFARVFSCRPGDSMYLDIAQKCQFW